MRVQHRDGVTGAGLGVGDAVVSADVDANYASRIPEYLEADATYYEPTGAFRYGESWIVRNEKAEAAEV